MIILGVLLKLISHSDSIASFPTVEPIKGVDDIDKQEPDVLHVPQLLTHSKVTITSLSTIILYGLKSLFIQPLFLVILTLLSD